MNLEIRNWPHFAIEMLSILLLVCCLLPLLKIGQLDGAAVPTHYDAAGQVDRTGSSDDMAALPLLALIMFAVLTVAEKVPKLMNAPKKLSENGKAYLQANSWKYAREIKLCIMALMTYITYWTYSIAAGKADGMPQWGLIVSVGALLAVTIRFYYRLYNYN
ncbi:MAG: hypothetical protein J6P50_06825 [Bacteroidales bacterium]|nr:hypothetical protein [Bacteroidales bacterium]